MSVSWQITSDARALTTELLHGGCLMESRPRCVVMAGPNGAGKSTHAHALVTQLHGIDRVINPDTVAAGIGAASADAVEIEAGRIVLSTIDERIAQRRDFAFETTLSGRRWPALLDRLRAAGFRCLLHYLWMPDASLCVERVRRRVRSGGHGVRDEDICRRYVSSLENFFTQFMPRCTAWRAYDSSQESGLLPIAHGGENRSTIIVDSARWRQLTDEAVSRGRVRETALSAYGSTVKQGERVSDPTAATHTARSDVEPESHMPPPSLMPSPEAVVAASRIAVRRALSIHRALGVSAAVMRDGKIVIIPPHELPLEANDPSTADPDETFGEYVPRLR